MAEDTFQEVWIKVMRAIESFDAERSSFRSWLYRIAHNAAVDLLRRVVLGFGRDVGKEQFLQLVHEAVDPTPGGEVRDVLAPHTEDFFCKLATHGVTLAPNGF